MPHPSPVAALRPPGHRTDCLTIPGWSFATMEGDPAGRTQDVKTATVSVQAVSVKLPEFYVSDPAGWLLHSEA